MRSDATLVWLDNYPEWRERVDKLGLRMYEAARGGFVELQETWVRRMKTQQFGPYQPGPTRRKLRTRSGHLRASVGGRVTGERLGTLRALLRVGGGRAGYARLHEKGGTIRPKRGRYLTVPLPEALRPGTGTLRPGAVIRRGADGYYTNFGPTVILQSGRHRVIYVRKARGRGRNRLMPLYVLKEQIRVKPRLNAEKQLIAVNRFMLPRLSKDLGTILAQERGAV
jgi:hypothetical protein